MHRVEGTGRTLELRPGGPLQELVQTRSSPARSTGVSKRCRSAYGLTGGDRVMRPLMARGPVLSGSGEGSQSAQMQ